MLPHLIPDPLATVDPLTERLEEVCEHGCGCGECPPCLATLNPEPCDDDIPY